MTCLGDVVAALVDGELDHAARERAHRHLAHCPACRAEVEAERRLKSRLAGATDDPAPSDALTARLMGLHAPGAPLRAPATTGAAARPVTARPVTVRSQPGPVARRPRRRRLRRRAAVGSTLAVLGLGAALALGAPQSRPPSTPVDPGTDAFVVDFISTTSDSGGAGGGR